MSLEIFDRSLAIRGARSATPAELAAADDMVRNGAIEALLADQSTILVVWSDHSCRETSALFIGPGVDEIIIVPTIGETCDATPNTRGVALEFRVAIDFEAIRFDLRPAQAATLMECVDAHRATAHAE